MNFLRCPKAVSDCRHFSSHFNFGNLDPIVAFSYCSFQNNFSLNKIKGFDRLFHIIRVYRRNQSLVYLWEKNKILIYYRRRFSCISEVKHICQVLFENKNRRCCVIGAQEAPSFEPLNTNLQQRQCHLILYHKHTHYYINK